MSGACAHFFIMQNQPISVVFDKERAASYDKRTDEWETGRAALFSFMKMILVELRPNARILCVGVGTGTELVSLAQAFPGWHFTAVDPSGAMLDVCREKVEENGLTARCTFHEGTLETLPVSGNFDGATCLLVSHFFRGEERSNFFRQIAARMRPGGLLISSDLVLGMRPAAYENLLKIWIKMLRKSGWGAAEIEKLRAAYGTHIASLSTGEIEAIIESGGFKNPVLFCQTLLIHAWYSRRA